MGYSPSLSVYGSRSSRSWYFDAPRRQVKLRQTVSSRSFGCWSGQRNYLRLYGTLCLAHPPKNDALIR
jgi:hypothetical protein